jgi:hypothetical protein
MKKGFVGLLLAVMLITGCTGFNPNVIADTATSATFVLVLQNNPSYKPVVIEKLNLLKTVLVKDTLTYGDLTDYLAVLFKNPQYGFVFYLLSKDIATDTPIFSNPLSKAYRDGIIKKVDELIFLATAFVA